VINLKIKRYLVGNWVKIVMVALSIISLVGTGYLWYSNQYATRGNEGNKRTLKIGDDKDTKETLISNDKKLKKDMNLLLIRANDEGIEKNLRERFLSKNYENKVVLDSIYIISFSAGEPSVSITPLPSELQVLYSNKGYYDELRYAFADGGIENLIKTCEDNFGLKLHNYLILDNSTTLKIIDSLGGNAQFLRDLVNINLNNRNYKIENIQKKVLDSPEELAVIVTEAVSAFLKNTNYGKARTAMLSGKTNLTKSIIDIVHNTYNNTEVKYNTRTVSFEKAEFQSYTTAQMKEYIRADSYLKTTYLNRSYPIYIMKDFNVQTNVLFRQLMSKTGSSSSTAAETTNPSSGSNTITPNPTNTPGALPTNGPGGVPTPTPTPGSTSAPVVTPTPGSTTEPPTTSEPVNTPEPTVAPTAAPTAEPVNTPVPTSTPQSEGED
jgi:hypothetical protein